MNSNKTLSMALGIPVEEKVQEEVCEQEILPPQPKEPDQVVTNLPDAVGFDRFDQQQDYDKARKTLHSVIETGETAIQSLAELAQETEEPRAYEVLATLIKSVTDATSEMYNIQKKTKDLNKTEAARGTGSELNVQKAVFVGTPSDLLTKMKKDGKI